MANIKVSELNEAITVNDSDLLMLVQNNESKKTSIETLKNNVNNFSTNEVEIGKWINGETLYRKTINIGTLPSVPGQKIKNHDISNLGAIVRMYGYAYSYGSGSYIPIPFSPSASTAVAGIAVLATSTDVRVQVAQDQSAFTVCYVTIEYTKTS